MQFTDIQNHEPIKQKALSIQQHLVQAKTNLRSGNSDQAEERLQEAMNALIAVVQHLQFSFSVSHIRQQDHEPVLMWLDRRTRARLQVLQELSGNSRRQVIVDLLQSGELSGVYRNDDAAARDD